MKRLEIRFSLNACTYVYCEYDALAPFLRQVACSSNWTCWWHEIWGICSKNCDTVSDIQKICVDVSNDNIHRFIYFDETRWIWDNTVLWSQSQSQPIAGPNTGCLWAVFGQLCIFNECIITLWRRVRIRNCWSFRWAYANSCLSMQGPVRPLNCRCLCVTRAGNVVRLYSSIAYFCVSRHFICAIVILRFTAQFRRKYMLFCWKVSVITGMILNCFLIASVSLVKSI